MFTGHNGGRSTNGELKRRMRASERDQKGAELRRSPDYLIPELFLDKIHCMCIF